MRIRILGLAALLAASPLAAADSPELPGWIEGAWEQAGPGELWADEFLTPPRGGLMLGAARVGAGEGPGLLGPDRVGPHRKGGRRLGVGGGSTGGSGWSRER